MLRLIVLVGLASMCSSGELGGYKTAVMKEFAHHKIQEGCFGKEMVMEKKLKMMQASKKCSVEVPQEGTTLMDFQEIINEVRNAALKFRGQDYDAGQYYKLVPVLEGSRYRRDTHDTTQMLEHLEKKVLYKIDNVTCMLKELNYMNDDKTPNYEDAEQQIYKINDAYLRKQLIYGFDMCKDFANCMPVKKAKTPIMKKVGTCLTFFKCMEMKKTEACLKKDFRERMAKYGFDAVEEKINMDLEMMGEEVHKPGMDAYKTLGMAMMGSMF